MCENNARLLSSTPCAVVVAPKESKEAKMKKLREEMNGTGLGLFGSHTCHKSSPLPATNLSWSVTSDRIEVIKDFEPKLVPKNSGFCSWQELALLEEKPTEWGNCVSTYLSFKKWRNPCSDEQTFLCAFWGAFHSADACFNLAVACFWRNWYSVCTFLTAGQTIHPHCWNCTSFMDQDQLWWKFMLNEVLHTWLGDNKWFDRFFAQRLSWTSWALHHSDSFYCRWII